jgi:hypothetical protein
MNDQKLRDQFEDWARPLRDAAPPAISVIRRRARRRITAMTVAGTSALAVTGLIVGLAVGAVPGLPALRPAATRSQAIGGRPLPPDPAVTARHPYPAGDPYLVTLDNAGAAAVVRNMADGQVLRSLAPPQPGTAFTWVAAAASDRLFLLADQQDGTGVARFYALRLGAAGQVLSLRLVPRAGTITGQIYGLAVSADGSEFAVATSPRLPGPGPRKIRVRGLTRPHPAQTWTSNAGAALRLSWAADDRLAFYWEPSDHFSLPGLRILYVVPGPSAAPRPLLSSSLLTVPGLTNSVGAQLTPDGFTVLAAVTAGSSGQDAARVLLGEYSAKSAQLLRWLPLTGKDTGLTYCGVLWSSRTGGTLITQCGNVQQAITDGKVTRIRLPLTIPAAAAGWQDTFAW